MAEHMVARGDVGAHEVTLVANTVETIAFESNLAVVEIVSDGAAALYLTVDGGTPTIKGGDCFYIPAGAESVREVESVTNAATVVRLISAGTPTVSVARVSK